VPCIISDLDEKTAKKYRIADNKIHETSIWDNDNLMIEMREIGEIENMQIYFPNIDLGNWLDDSVGFNIEATTQKEYDKKETELNERFDTNVQKESEAKLNIICPHCLEEFELNKTDL
jgi:ribosomal protein L5